MRLEFREFTMLLICSCLFAALPATLAAETLTKEIDRYLTRNWNDQDIVPAPVASDAEFLRRASLDLTGVVPTVARAREFFADDAADKRSLVIDELLRSPRHATHLANQWRRILLPHASNLEVFEAVAGTQAWLRERFLQNLRYDRFVGEFLTVTGSASTGPVLFYQAHEFAPEKLAAATARSFFGIRLGCAQCHDHPFDAWRQEDFWSYAAFFARVQPDGRIMNRTGSLIEAPTGEVSLPDETEPVNPRFLDGVPANGESNRRLELSIWATSQDNPFIARAAVNRVWAMLFGRGLSEPVDDLGTYNPPDHPDLLNLLAQRFVESGYDLRELFRALAKTDAYQRSSRSDEHEALPPATSFSRMKVKPLTPDQLFDSLGVVLLLRRWQNLEQPSSTEVLDPQRMQFVTAMTGLTSSPTAFRSGLQQTLQMMNGTEFGHALSDPSAGLLATLDAPFLSDVDRLEILFLATFCRHPTEAELNQLESQLPLSASERPSFYADLLWAMANSAEFRMNH